MMETGDQREEQVNGTTHPVGPTFVVNGAEVDPTGIEGLVAYHIGKQYRRRPVLRDVTIGVQLCEAVGLLGPNGAGKTVLLHHDRSHQGDAGAIYLDGERSPTPDVFARPRAGAICRRRLDLPRHDVADNIMAVLGSDRADKRERDHRHRRLLAGLRRRPSRSAGDRSVGRRRRRMWRSRCRAANGTVLLDDRWPASVRSRSRHP
jgi:lipopolysaccharide export system ATP-binding protein